MIHPFNDKKNGGIDKDKIEFEREILLSSKSSKLGQFFKAPKNFHTNNNLASPN